MNYYNIDFKKLMVLLLPIRNRKSKYIAFLNVIASQLQKILYDFNEYRTNIDATRKTQTCKMRGLLNDYFDHYQRRIQTVTLAPNYDDYLTHKRITGKFKVVSKANPYLTQKRGHLLTNHTSFKVVLPVGFDLTTSQEILMRRLVDTNKLPSTTYIITHE